MVVYLTDTTGNLYPSKHTFKSASRDPEVDRRTIAAVNQAKTQRAKALPKKLRDQRSRAIAVPVQATKRDNYKHMIHVGNRFALVNQITKSARAIHMPGDRVEVSLATARHFLSKEKKGTA